MSLDVGIVAYGSPGLLRDCLASLRQHPPSRPMRVLVVDNAAPERVATIAREFPEVELLEPGRNLGFAAATNAVIRRTGGEYFLALNPDTRVRDLTDDEVNRIRVYVDQNLRVEGDLRRDIAQDIKRKIEIGSYQGVRHRKGLPVRGQRTHTNARTRKGPKKTVAGKKKVKK